MMTPLIDTNQPRFPSRGTADQAQRPWFGGKRIRGAALAIAIVVPAGVMFGAFFAPTQALLSRVGENTTISVPFAGTALRTLAAVAAPLLRATDAVSSVMSASQGYLAGFKMEDGGAGG